MKIGVISDTHLKISTPFLNRVIGHYFKDVDLVLHAGDITTPDVLEAFNGKELIAVSGNMDSPEIKRRFPQKETVTVKGITMGLTHGTGSPFGITKRVRVLFPQIDCIVFGHTHVPMNKTEGGTLFFNPGSFKACIPHFWRRTIGILEIKDGIKGRVIRIPRSFRK